MAAQVCFKTEQLNLLPLSCNTSRFVKCLCCSIKEKSILAFNFSKRNLRRGEFEIPSTHLFPVRSEFLEFDKPVDQRIDSVVPSNSDVLTGVELYPQNKKIILKLLITNAGHCHHTRTHAFTGIDNERNARISEERPLTLVPRWRTMIAPGCAAWSP
jgi:hypothetical protein